MSKAPGSTVLRQIENGLTVQVIEVETDWTPEEIVELGREEGYVVAIDGTFRSTDPHLAVVQADENPISDGDTTSPEQPATEPLTDPAALIAAGAAHDYEDVQEAAREAAAWLDILAERIIQAEHHRAAIADVEHYEQLLHAARIKAGLVEADEPTVEAPPYDGKTVRAWAAANGVTCPARGKVPRAVVDAYLDAHEAGAA